MTSDLPLRSKQELAAPSVSVAKLSESQHTEGERYYTNRFTYVPGGDNNPTTSSATTSERIFRCDDEPIHNPGAIQSFGSLIAVREEADFFVVRIVSENTQSVTGIEPDALFQQRCFTDFLTPPERTEFITRARAFYADTSRSNPDVFSVSLLPLGGAPRRLFCAMHFNKVSDLIVCEFELDRDFIVPEQLPNSGFPPEPIQIIHNEATDDELLLSRTRRSKPLHSLQIARSSARQLTLMDSFQTVLEIQAQLSSAPDLTVLGDVIVGLVHDLTGFHRVMIYQFDDTTAGMFYRALKCRTTMSNSYQPGDRFTPSVSCSI